MGRGVCLGMADDADRRAEGRNHRERVGPPGYCGLGLRLLEHLRGCPCVPARLQDGAGGDCLEAPRITLPVGPLAGLAEVQESGGSCGEA